VPSCISHTHDHPTRRAWAFGAPLTLEAQATRNWPTCGTERLGLSNKATQDQFFIVSARISFGLLNVLLVTDLAAFSALWIKAALCCGSLGLSLTGSHRYGLLPEIVRVRPDRRIQRGD